MIEFGCLRDLGARPMVLLSVLHTLHSFLETGLWEELATWMGHVTNQAQNVNSLSSSFAGMLKK